MAASAAARAPETGRGSGEALARPSRRLRPGMRLSGGGELNCSSRWVTAAGSSGSTAIRTATRRSRRTSAPLSTTRAATRRCTRTKAGSAAAPTAGLHFTPELLGRLPGVEAITLHVGLDTFRPVTSGTVEEHPIHGERYRVEPDAWERIQAATCVVAVGTTTVRVRETLRGRPDGSDRPPSSSTPGFGSACRLPGDQLPSAAHEACSPSSWPSPRWSRRELYPSRSQSATGSTPSAMPC